MHKDSTFNTYLHMAVHMHESISTSDSVYAYICASVQVKLPIYVSHMSVSAVSEAVVAAVA